MISFKVVVVNIFLCLHICKNAVLQQVVADKRASLLTNSTAMFSSVALEERQQSNQWLHESLFNNKRIKNHGFNGTIATNRHTSERKVDEIGILKVQGHHIVDTITGEIVYLRGVNMDCYFYFDPSTRPQAQMDWYADEGDIQYLKGIGVTSIRLVLHWHYFGTSLGYDLIDQYLQWCSKNSIHIILNMHVVPPDDDFGNELIWTDESAKQQLVDLWTTIAARYKPMVWIAGYDIYNEPRAPKSDDWWDLAERVIEGIRTVDTDHIVFVEISPYPDIEIRKLADTNVVYSYHDYEPFQVSHAGVSYSLDSPVPNTYSYPGRVLLDTQWVGYSNKSKPLTGQTRTWKLLDSGNVKPFVYDGLKGPIEYIAIRIDTFGNTGSVYVDDLQVYKNGKLQKLLNPGFEAVAPSDSSRPRHWYFWSPKNDVSGSLSTEYYRPSRGSKMSLKLYGNQSDSYGEWTNVNTFFTKQLFRSTKTDVFRLRGWVLAPENNKGGEVSMVLDYRTGVYKTYNTTTLREYIQPVIDWAKRYDVPLYVGEFGSGRNAPGTSRNNLIRDKIALMNSEEMHWSVWTYRQPEGTVDFALFTDDKVDTELESILKDGLL